MKDWQKALISPLVTIRETLQLIDDSSMQIAIIVDEANRLLGIVTDGDLRRGLIRGISLDEPVSIIMNSMPITAGINKKQREILALMKQKQIRHIPILNNEGIIVGLEVLEHVLDHQQRKANWVFIMAGGLGLRLRPLTNDYPKPLLKVGNKPILETIIENLSEYGLNQIYLLVNYKAEMIKEYLGDGTRFGAEIRYIHEEKRLGTAGGLSLITEKFSEPIIVMNGDILTKLNFQQLLEFHNKVKPQITMCIRQYGFQVPYGVVKIDKNNLLDIEEKPLQQFFVNAGIYVLDPLVLKLIPKEAYFDMTSLIKKINDNKVAVFPIREYWLDIGKIDDYDRANGEYNEVFG